MPNKPAAEKSMRQTKTATARNKALARTITFLTKEYQIAVKDDKDLKAVAELAKKIQQALDKAAKTGFIKKNTAARKKSRLFKKKA